MRTVVALGGVSLAVSLCLVQACSSDGEATQADPDSGVPDPGSSSGSSGSSSGSSGSSSGSSGSSSGSSGSSGTPDAGTDAAEGGSDAGKSVMTFFVTSTGSGALGGNLGGLVGADAKCTTLATAAGGGDHTWKAYLSTNTNNGGTKVDAKDRIGPGPWKNQKGVVIPTTIHTVNLTNAMILDEKGATVPNVNPYPTNVHDILTGSNDDGTARTENCQNWTSANAGTGRVGHSDSSTGKWNDAHTSQGCSKANLNNQGGEGRFYCFATD
jgi:hypothetical protein